MDPHLRYDGKRLFPVEYMRLLSVSVYMKTTNVLGKDPPFVNSVCFLDLLQNSIGSSLAHDAPRRQVR